MKIFLLILCASFVYGSDEKSSIQKLPEGIPSCQQDDANLRECLKNVYQEMIPKLRDGNKDLNIPPIDPFYLGKNSYQYSNGALQGRVSIKDTKIFGLSKAIIKDVDFVLLSNGTYHTVSTYVPKILVEGVYKAEIKFNDVRLNPKGYFNISMTDLSVNTTMDSEFYEKDGHRYLRVAKFEATPEIGDMKIYASGLFPDPTLNAIILDFINQYWREIYKLILPETRQYYEPLALALANEFLKSYPFEVFLTKNQN